MNKIILPYFSNRADKDDKFKKKMIEVFKEQIIDLEEVVPNFKIANAIIHFDESSPLFSLEIVKLFLFVIVGFRLSIISLISLDLFCNSSVLSFNSLQINMMTL